MTLSLRQAAETARCAGPGSFPDGAASASCVLVYSGVTLSLSVRSLSGSCLTSGSNNIDISHQGSPEESGAIRIGTVRVHTSAFIAGIRDAPVAGAVPLGVTTSGQLGVAASSKRFKEAIRPMNAASEAIFALKPVIFHYKQELDNDGILQFGLVAEDVEKVTPIWWCATRKARFTLPRKSFSTISKAAGEP